MWWFFFSSSDSILWIKFYKLSEVSNLLITQPCWAYGTYWPEFSKVYYLQINWLFKSVDYNKREIGVIQHVQNNWRPIMTVPSNIMRLLQLIEDNKPSRIRANISPPGLVYQGNFHLCEIEFSFSDDNEPVHKGVNRVPKAISDRDSDPFLIWKPDFTLCECKDLLNQAFETQRKWRFGSWST